MSLRLGIPNGSSISPERGGLLEALCMAGIHIRDLCGKMPPYSEISWLYPVIGRPQELPAFASEGRLDCFFCGTDWVEEWSVRGIISEPVCYPLKNEATRIVYAAKSEREPSVVATEYAGIAKRYLEGKYMREFRVFCPGESRPESGIMLSAGKTEAKAYYGWADGIVEIVQSGDTLKNFGIVEIETIMQTRIGLWKAPDLPEEKERQAALLEKMLMDAY